MKEKETALHHRKFGKFKQSFKYNSKSKTELALKRYQKSGELNHKKNSQVDISLYAKSNSELKTITRML